MLSAIPTRQLIAVVLFGSLGLLASSCTNQPLPPAEYATYLADPAHGLSHTVEVNGTNITCAYCPTDQLIYQELATSPIADAHTRDSLARVYTGKTYCTLTLGTPNGEFENQFVSTPAFYQQVLTYLNTGIATDAFLATTPRDSVAALASLYVRQFGTTGHSTILLVFDTHQLQPQQGFHLTLRGQQLGLSTLRFSFSAADLAALPPLRAN